MKLIELKIELNKWGDNEGKYTAEIEYEAERGKTTLQLEPGISEALLGFIGPVITTFAHATSLKLEECLKQSLAEAQKVPAIDMPAPAETESEQ